MRVVVASWFVLETFLFKAFFVQIMLWFNEIENATKCSYFKEVYRSLQA